MQNIVSLPALDRLELDSRTASAEQEEMQVGPSGNLQFFWYNINRMGPGILVLPNGYGALSYLKTVCTELADIGCSVSALNFSGQGESEGKLSLEAMTNDLDFALRTAYERFDMSNGLTVFANCTAMLPILELNKRGYDWSAVRLIILYGYLAHPAKHFPRFIRKARKYKVRVCQEPDSLPPYGPNDFAAIPVPLVVIHPRIPNNIHRASVSDVVELAEIAKPTAFYVPDFGYAISDHPQNVSVRKIISSFVSPHLSIDAQAHLITTSLNTMKRDEHNQ